MATILLVEDEQLLRWSIKQRLEQVGHKVEEAADLADASSYLHAHQPDLLILDLSLPDGHGLDFYQENLTRLEGTVVLITTAVGEVDDAVRAMKLGALDFLQKPVQHESLLQLIDRSLDIRSTELEAEVARGARERELSMEVIAHSAAFRRTLEIAADVAQTDVSSVLIQGESGTGKNLVARYIHAVSARSDRPLLVVSCAAIPEQLLESELFGHERGAFTDAKKLKRGTFELANNGTVVLDEIGELKLGLQSKLLQFLEERFFRRVGGIREIHVDIAVVALTNRNLKQMMQEGTFREDLFYRLNVFPITVPPLRERLDDIIPLADHFLKSLRGKHGRQAQGFSREAEQKLLSYSWPGNARELRNTVERAVILGRGNEIGCRSLVLDGFEYEENEAGAESQPEALPAGIVPLEKVERIMVRRALDATNDNQTQAAELLGISRDQLRYRLKKFGASLQEDDKRQPPGE
jgi:DNA-binding NtrC family response regulator